MTKMYESLVRAGCPPLRAMQVARGLTVWARLERVGHDLRRV